LKFISGIMGKTSKETSMAELALSGIKSLEKYAASEDAVDKLLALNALLFVVNFAFLFTGNFMSKFETVSFVIYVIFGAIFGAIILLGYVPILDLIKKVIQKNYFAFNFSAAILLISASLGVVGAILTQEFYLRLALYGLIAQFMSLFVFGLFIKLPVKEELAKNITNNAWNLFWNVLDKISIVGGVISLIILVLNFAL